MNSVADNLKAIRDYMSKHGMCKGSLQEPAYPTTGTPHPMVCIHGGINLIMSGSALNVRGDRKDTSEVQVLFQVVAEQWPERLVSVRLSPLSPLSQLVLFQ